MSNVHSDTFEGVVVGVPSSFRIVIQHRVTHAAHILIPACIRIPSADDEAHSYAAKDLIRRQFMGYTVSVTHVKDHARIRRVQDNLDLTTSLMKNGLAWCHESDRVYNEFHEHKAALLELQAVAKRRGIGVHDPCIRTAATLRSFHPLPPAKDPFRNTTINSIVASRGVMRFSVERVISCCSFSGFIPACGQLITVRLIGVAPPPREAAARSAANKISAKLLHRIVSVLVYDFDAETDEFIVELTSVQNNKLVKELIDTGYLTQTVRHITDSAAADYDKAFFEALQAKQIEQHLPITAPHHASSSAIPFPTILPDAHQANTQKESPKVGHTKTAAPLAVDADYTEEAIDISAPTAAPPSEPESLSPEDNIDLSLEAIAAELAGEIHFGESLDAIGHAFRTPTHTAGIPSPHVSAAAGVDALGAIEDGELLPPPTYNFESPKIVDELPQYAKPRTGIVIGVRNEVTLDIVETRTLRSKGTTTKERIFHKVRLDGTRAPSDVHSEPSTHASTVLILDQLSFETREVLRRAVIGKSVTFFLRGKTANNSDKSTTAVAFMPISEATTIHSVDGPRGQGYVDIAGTVRSILGIVEGDHREGSGVTITGSETSPDLAATESPNTTKEPTCEPQEIAQTSPSNDGMVEESPVSDAPPEAAVVDPLQYCLSAADNLFLPPLVSMSAADRQLADFGAMLSRGAATNDEMVRILCGGWEVPHNKKQPLETAEEAPEVEEKALSQEREKSPDPPAPQEIEQVGPVKNDGEEEQIDLVPAEPSPTITIDYVDNDGVLARLDSFESMIAETLSGRDEEAVVEEFDPVTLNFSLFFPGIGVQCPFQLPSFLRFPRYNLDTHGIPQAHIDTFYEMYEFLEDTVVHRDCVVQCTSVNAEKGCVTGSISMQIDQLPSRWAQRLGVTDVIANYKAACEEVMQVRAEMLRVPEDLSSKLDRESEEYTDEEIRKKLPPIPLPPVVDLLGMLATLGYTAVVPSKIMQRLPLNALMNVLCRQETARLGKAGVWGLKATSKLYRHCGMADVDRAFERCLEAYPEISTELVPADPSPSARARTRIRPLVRCGLLSFLYRETGTAYAEAYERLQEVLKAEAMPMRERRVFAGDLVVLRLAQPLPGTELTEKAVRGPPRPADADDSDAKSGDGNFYYRAVLTTKVYRRKALMVDVNLVDFLNDKPISILLRDVRLPDTAGVVEGLPSLIKRGRHSFLAPRVTAFEFLHSVGTPDSAVYEYYPEPVPSCEAPPSLVKVSLATLKMERSVLQEAMEGLCEVTAAYMSEDFKVSSDVVVKCDPCHREGDEGVDRGPYLCGCVFADNGNNGPSLVLPPASLSLLMKCPNLLKVDSELVNHSIAFAPIVYQLLMMSQAGKDAALYP